MENSKFFLLAPVLSIALSVVAFAEKPVPTLESSTTPTMPNDWVLGHEAMTAARKARSEDIQIVLLGDSITERWTTGAGWEIYKRRYASKGAVNLGISADSTHQVLWRIKNGALDGMHPKMVLLLIGTNNFALSDPEAVAYGVWAIVDEIRRTHPETRVLVQGIFPKDRPPGHGEKVKPTNALLSKLDDGRMVRFVDFGDEYLNPDGTLNKALFPDGVHPEKQEAFEIWADSIQPIVDEWLEAPPIADVPPPAAPVSRPKDLLPATPEARNDWLSRFKTSVSQAARGNADLLFLGDTTMSCWGRVEPLFEKEYRSYRAINGAIWGSRTEHILWQLDNGGIDGLTPHLVVLQVQDNLADSTPAENVAAGTEAIVRRIRAKLPGAKILLEGAFPIGTTAEHALRKKVEKYNGLISRFADKKNVIFLDPFSAFLNSDGSIVACGTPGPNKFNPEAYELWANVQRDKIAELMGTAH